MGINSFGSAATASSLPDRSALSTRLEETRLAFHHLVEKLPNEEWSNKRTATGWTARELISHIVDGLVHAPEAINHVRRGKQFLNPPSFLHRLVAPVNFWMSKWNVRGQTRQTILTRYDAAHQALLKTIEDIRDDEWSHGAHCYGEGYMTVLDLCILPNRHLQEHTAQLLGPQEFR